MSSHPGPGVTVTARRDRDGPTVVMVIGELDLATRDELRKVVAGCDGDVVIDLAGVGFLDSSSIGVIAGQRNRLVRSGGSLTLQRPQRPVRHTLETVGLGAWIAA